MFEKQGVEIKQSKIDIVEKKYATEKEVSIGKAMDAARHLKVPVMVEDTGIYFEDYNNFPGPNAKVFFTGVGFDGVLKLLEGKNRNAFFRTSIAFCKPDSNPVCFIGDCKGRIAEKVSDVIDFDYDSLFIPEGDERTFSQMGKEEKEKFSHRKKAFDEFFKWYKETELSKSKGLKNPFSLK